ncbi:MAG: BlaI/MecI/CopY family transcriptional regulator [Eubacterium sp.]|nr:BlaI/MecI/CopY family transcriptional regulator [Eubacterium sp.]
MEEKAIGLSNSEWNIMENLWESSPKTATQLIRAMEEKIGWAKSTTKTVLRRMEQKGYIAYYEGEKAREYYPVLKREEVVESETSSFLNRIYNGSLGLLVNTLVKKQDIPDEEMEELYKIIKEAKESRQ